MANRTTGMTRKTERPTFRCTECGWTTGKWVGRCAECHEWASIEEVGATADRAIARRAISVSAQPIGEVSAVSAAARTTGVPEFDRVLGGGIVPGSVVLLAGEPGVGKSTLLLDVAARAARLTTGSGRLSKVLYVTGEESSAQVRLRADRIGAVADTLYLAAESDLGAVLAQIDALDPDLCVLDSVQTISAAEVDGSAGGVSQVRQVAASLIREAKAREMATVIVGHVTKDGSIAGPRVLEHLVDVVCQFEGDRHSQLRLVRSVKNRYGPTDEVGCFDLSDGGIEGLADPSGLFLSHGAPSANGSRVPGTCVTVTVEGRRPLISEVQALVMESSLSNPRRVTSGIDSSRLAMILAVLDRRLGLDLGKHDAYVSTVGGSRLNEPSTDLATALAIRSARLDEPLLARLVAFGEVGLAGELRPVTSIERRLAEAARLGFTTAIVPLDPRAGAPKNGTVRGREDGAPKTGIDAGPRGMRVLVAGTLLEASELAFAPAATTAPRLRA